MTSDRPDPNPTPLAGHRAEDAEIEVMLDADLAARLAEVDPPDPQRRDRAIAVALDAFDTAPWRTGHRRRPRWQLASIAAAALLIVGGGIAALGIVSTPGDELASNDPVEEGLTVLAGPEEPARLAASAPEQTPTSDEELASSATSEPLVGAVPTPNDDDDDLTAAPPDSPGDPRVIDTPEDLAEFAVTTPARSVGLPGCAPSDARGLGAITYRGVPAVAIAIGDAGMIHAMAADDCRILATVTVAPQPTTD